MNFKTLAMLALVALPGLAQERWQVGLNLNSPLATEAEYQPNGSQFFRLRRKEAVNPAIMVGYRAWDLGRSDVSITGEYQFRTSSDIETTNVNRAAAGYANGKTTQPFRAEFWAPGVQWNLHQAVDWGFGLQYRFARLKYEDVKDNNNRPWLSAYIGYTFKTRSPVKPYIGLRSSVALASSGKPDWNALGDGGNGDKQLLRHMDGNQETSIQLGMRF